MVLVLFCNSVWSAPLKLIMHAPLWSVSSDLERPHGRKSFPRQESFHRGSLNLFSPAPRLSSVPPAEKVVIRSTSPPANFSSCPQKPSISPLPNSERVDFSTPSFYPGSCSSKVPKEPVVPKLSFPSTGTVFVTESQRDGSTVIPRRGHYTNQESTTTKEFLTVGRRRFVVKPKLQHGEGIKFFRNAPAALQNIQVVNITNAYKDPVNISTPRLGIRCRQPSLNCSSEMRETMEYKGTSEQLRGMTLQVPIGVTVKKCQKRTPAGCSSSEIFLEAVRDHCEQRARGVTQFYVSLCRDVIGASTPSTPRVQKPRLWELEEPPTPNTLTLLRCRDQLVSLTSISISLRELASLIWDASTLKKQDGSFLEEADLENRLISYVEFSSAFSK